MENVRNVNLYLCTSKTKTQVACVADELNPGIVRLRISDQKLVLPPVCYQGFL